MITSFFSVKTFFFSLLKKDLNFLFIAHLENLKNQSLKVVRVDKHEFELENGDVYPIPFELDVDEDISVLEFQKIMDSSKELMLKILEQSNE